ncbi:hypothetical protein E4U59_003283 [Claviceps monticola]|nr:hypothetical protein E4U59_003283 [Claviceps monticola]
MPETLAVTVDVGTGPYKTDAVEAASAAKRKKTLASLEPRESADYLWSRNSSYRGIQRGQLDLDKM